MWIDGRYYTEPEMIDLVHSKDEIIRLLSDRSYELIEERNFYKDLCMKCLDLLKGAAKRMDNAAAVERCDRIVKLLEEIENG